MYGQVFSIAKRSVKLAATQVDTTKIQGYQAAVATVEP